MVSDFQPQETCPTRVYCNGTRLPANDVDVHIRKEGPLAINRYAEVNFTSPWDGEDYLSLFNTLKDPSNQDGFDLLRIETRNKELESEDDTEPYSTLFHGFVTGIGGSNHDSQKIHQCRSQGFEHLLDSIPASNAFKGQYTNKDILEYIHTEYTDKLGELITVSTTYNTDVEQLSAEGGLLTVLPGSLIGLVKAIKSNKTFLANKHTLTNVVNWFSEKTNQQVWFQPVPEGVSLIIADNLSQNSTHHTAHYLQDGETQIINNNALSEIKPINSVVLNSKATGSTADVDLLGFDVTSIGDKEFTQVKARHLPLYKRSGGVDFSDTIKKSDSETKRETEQEAKKKLKERIDGATSGSMQVVHNKYIQPFDTIEARPTVNEVANDDINSLTYEVSRCHYKAHHTTDGIPHIDVQAGIHTDVEEDIEIIRTNEKDA